MSFATVHRKDIEWECWISLVESPPSGVAVKG